ncbi:MAG: TIM barrel protein, partial [Actinomycetota bacterium]
LERACDALARAAAACGVRIGIEPEPGMLLERIDEYLALCAALGDSAPLGVTLDLGHCHSFEDDPAGECVHRVAGRIVNVHIEDARRGVHEHLDFGDGEIAFPPVLAALRAAGYRGLVCVELSRHSHVAHVTVPRAIGYLRAAERQAVAA